LSFNKILVDNYDYLGDHSTKIKLRITPRSMSNYEIHPPGMTLDVVESSEMRPGVEHSRTISPGDLLALLPPHLLLTVLFSYTWSFSGGKCLDTVFTFQLVSHTTKTIVVNKRLRPLLQDE
jgi:hypothetical protein